MRQRLRSHLTFANVASLIALFIALSGGTAFAAVIITSNSQVAQNTISGHHPPSGKHANIINGSVSNKDVLDLVFHDLTLNPGWTGGCFGTCVAEPTPFVTRIPGGPRAYAGAGWTSRRD